MIKTKRPEIIFISGRFVFISRLIYLLDRHDAQNAVVLFRRVAATVAV